MERATVIRLDQLNRLFYEENAKTFAASRAQAWPGWHQFLPHLKHLFSQRYLYNRILDIGSGNGRLASFLQQTFPEPGQPTKYFGWERSAFLRREAEARHKPLADQYWQFHTYQANLVDWLLAESAGAELQAEVPQMSQVVFLLSVLHHIPSFQFRRELLDALASRLAPEGFLIFNTWQFLNSPKLKARLVSPAQLGFAEEDLEPHDYFLDWRAETPAYRYCHYFDNEEEVALLKGLPLHVIDDYFADGQGGRLNHYLICQRPDYD